MMKLLLHHLKKLNFKKIDEAVIQNNNNGFKKIDEATIQDNDIILVVTYVAQTH